MWTMRSSSRRLLLFSTSSSLSPTRRGRRRGCCFAKFLRPTSVTAISAVLLALVLILTITLLRHHLHRCYRHLQALRGQRHDSASSSREDYAEMQLCSDEKQEQLKLLQDERNRGTDKKIGEDPDGKKVPLVLGWTTWFGQHNLVEFVKGGADAPVVCSHLCEYSDDRSSYHPSRRTVFLHHSPDINPDDLPPAGISNNHLNVFYSLESPANSGNAYRRLPRADFFNLTMSYRVDSDVWAPYDLLEPLDDATPEEERWTQKEVEGRVARKQRSAVIFVSHCETSSRREDYLRELKRYINVTEFGACSNHSCHECLETELDSHFFYLAFENSVCHDYVTEKFWYAKRLIVPVVLSGWALARYPADSLPAYIAADDFHSPRHLAEHLLHMQHSRHRYLHLLRWTKRSKRKTLPIGKLGYPDPNGAHGLCQLCQMAHEGLQANVPNITDFWEGGAACKKDYSMRELLRPEKNKNRQDSHSH